MRKYLVILIVSCIFAGNLCSQTVESKFLDTIPQVDFVRITEFKKKNNLTFFTACKTDKGYAILYNNPQYEVYALYIDDKKFVKY